MKLVIYFIESFNSKENYSRAVNGDNHNVIFSLKILSDIERDQLADSFHEVYDLFYLGSIAFTISKNSKQKMLVERYLRDNVNFASLDRELIELV